VGTTITLELPRANAKVAPEKLGTAAISVADPRSAAAVELLLREAGYTTRREPVSGRGPDADLWVVDCNARLDQSAAAFTGRGGTLAMVGDAPARLPGGSVHIRDPFDLEAGREAIYKLSLMGRKRS
jgi:hypothetical protein